MFTVLIKNLEKNFKSNYSLIDASKIGITKFIKSFAHRVPEYHRPMVFHWSPCQHAQAEETISFDCVYDFFFSVVYVDKMLWFKKKATLSVEQIVVICFKWAGFYEETQFCKCWLYNCNFFVFTFLKRHSHVTVLLY